VKNAGINRREEGEVRREERGERREERGVRREELEEGGCPPYPGCGSHSAPTPRTSPYWFDRFVAREGSRLSTPEKLLRSARETEYTSIRRNTPNPRKPQPRR
jgi:hypothetical protein